MDYHIVALKRYKVSSMTVQDYLGKRNRECDDEFYFAIRREESVRVLGINESIFDGDIVWLIFEKNYAAF